MALRKIECLATKRLCCKDCHLHFLLFKSNDNSFCTSPHLIITFQIYHHIICHLIPSQNHTMSVTFFYLTYIYIMTYFLSNVMSLHAQHNFFSEYGLQIKLVKLALFVDLHTNLVALFCTFSSFFMWFCW